MQRVGRFTFAARGYRCLHSIYRHRGHMAKIVMEGGTDVAEMALFSLDVLPEDAAGEDDLERMQREGHAVRFPTGADGGYLLHIYLDEPIPDALEQYCEKDDVLTGKLHAGSGKVGFGGVESAYRKFKPNDYIRADAVLPGGTYDLVAYHTDYPEELIEGAIDAHLDAAERRLLNLPGRLTLLFLLAAFIAFVVAVARKAPVGVIALMIATLMLMSRSKRYKAVSEKSKAAQMDFPSIVVEMRFVQP